MATTKLWTAEEIESLPEDEAVFELWHGERKRVSPTGGRHGATCLRIARHLAEHADASAIGEVLIDDVGFALARDPDLLLGPDVAIIAAQDLPVPDGFIDTVP